VLWFRPKRKTNRKYSVDCYSKSIKKEKERKTIKQDNVGTWGKTKEREKGHHARRRLTGSFADSEKLPVKPPSKLFTKAFTPGEPTGPHRSPFKLH